MPPNVKVCINGFVLSTLLFDCTNNTSDQEGFLYGSITRNVRREISDHSMSNTQEDILISICSSVPSGSFLSFYNNVGEIKREDLEYNLAERAENIVGWYRFRRYSAMFPSVREQSTHRHLRDLFNNWDRLVDTSYFVFGILSSSNLPNYATHSYDYGFFIQRRDGTFKDLPLTILNLGDTRNSYRAGSMALPFMNSSSFNSVLSSSWNFDTFFDTENQIHEFHQRLRAKLDSLQEELAASDAVNASLEDDIKRLSNEMQALLATQERLACAAAAARESERAEINVDAEKLKYTGVNKEEKLKLKENEKDEDCVREDEKNEKEREAVNTGPEISEVYVLDVNEANTEASETVEACKIGITASTDSKINIDNQKCDSCDSKDDHSNVKESEQMDYNEDSRSSSKEKAGSPSGLKRALVFPSADDLSAKRACPDKYFENEEHLNAKSEEKSAEDVTPTTELEDTSISTCHKKISDPASSELPSQQNEQNDVSPCVIEEPKIPSPASNVEIVISDTGLQSFEPVIQSAFMMHCILTLVLYGILCSGCFLGVQVDETLSSSDELSDIKESGAKEVPSLVCCSKSSDVSENSKSLSDSDICYKTEVLTSDRCGSAPAEFLSDVTGSSDEKLVVDGSTSKSSSSNQSFSKINPPFIVYAAKKSESEPVPVSGESLYEPRESVKGKVVDENSQSPPQDKKNEQKNDVPQGPVRKME